MKVRVRTGYWQHMINVEKYYGDSTESTLKEGRAIIGKPPIKSNQRLLIDRSNGQYIIEGEDNA